jgi:mannose-6-phosphate isomerase-like protein (cupin superfamily)
VERKHEKTLEGDHRPWGYYVVLSDEPDHKVKRIVVYPQKRLSLQRHKHRSEHWVIVKGEALVTLDDKDFRLTKEMSIDVPASTAHRIKNTGDEDLSFIEIQQGSYFGEDDIERFEDDFGRAPPKKD